MPKIILIEDDSGFGYILSEYLQLHDFEVSWYKSGQEGLQALEKQRFDVGIFDIMLPDVNGFEIAANLQARGIDLPFLFLSAKTLKVDKLKGYKLGAEDYITKPVDEELLLAKLKVILNRRPSSTENKAIISIGTYTFSPSLQTLSIDNYNIQLTKREAELLELLCTYKNQLLSRKKALTQIWHNTDEFSRKSMDVFISKLRKHLNKDQRISIRNIHGQGFILEVDE